MLFDAVPLELVSLILLRITIPVEIVIILLGSLG